MNIWLPKVFYNIKPLLYMLAALLVLILARNIITITLAAALLGYAIWICWKRFQWKESGIVY